MSSVPCHRIVALLAFCVIVEKLYASRDRRRFAASTAPRPHQDGVLCMYKNTVRCIVCMYRQAAKTLLGLPKFRCCVAQAAELRARSLPPLHCFASRARCATGFAQSRVFHVLSAASHSATNAKPDVQANLRQALELGVQLPELCSGCGVRLQAETSDAPGYVQQLFRLHHKVAAFMYNANDRRHADTSRSRSVW